MPQSPPPQRPVAHQQPAPQPYQRTVQPPPRQPQPQYQQVAPAASVEVVEEFEAFDDDMGEEISEEEYEAERRALRRRRVAGGVAASVMGVLAALVVFVLLFGPTALPYVDSFQPTPLQQSDLAIPSVPGWEPDMGDPRPTPQGA
ncbi:MAG: hypothetical protein JSW25_02600, partial [Thermoplasmata archaeon]